MRPRNYTYTKTNLNNQQTTTHKMDHIIINIHIQSFRLK